MVALPVARLGGFIEQAPQQLRSSPILGLALVIVLSATPSDVIIRPLLPGDMFASAHNHASG